MRELSQANLYTVADAFRVIELLAETIFETVIANPYVDQEVAKQVSEDAAIISDRMKAAINILDAEYPGLREIILLADRRSEKRALEIIAQRQAEHPRH